MIKKFNYLYLKANEQFEQWAKNRGLTSNSLWVAYFLIEHPYSQQELSQLLSLPKSTIHSILKEFQQAGYVYLEYLPNNRKTKGIYLTKDGQNFFEKILDDLSSGEHRVLERMGDDKFNQFVTLLEEYTNILEEEL